MTQLSAVTEACRQWAVEGEIIQIVRDSILFRPRVSTHPFRLLLDGTKRPDAIGPATLIILPAAYDCRRIVAKRGIKPKPIGITYHGDEIESVRGRLLARLESPAVAILDLGFPIVVEELEPCPELARSQPDEMIELELAPPTKALML